MASLVDSGPRAGARVISASGPILRILASANGAVPVAERSIMKVPVALVAGESHIDIARKLVASDTFMALALGVEDVPGRAYMDAAGANVGAGYCVEMRRRIYGDAQIAAELAQAGFKPAEVASLMSRQEALVESVEVDNAQALRLLSITKPQYSTLARNAVGPSVFDALPSHKKDALTYLAYNTGTPASFVKLMQAVRAVAALSELAPSFALGKGRKVKNHRLRAWAQAAWIGPEALGKALSKPGAFESTYASIKGQRRFILAHWSLLDGADARDLARLDAREAREAGPKAKERGGKQRAQKTFRSGRLQVAKLGSRGARRNSADV